ncbi:MAG: photosynthetic reaction center cytochrome c subunit family protein, partial [Gemmatimonadota bacterium]
MGYRRLVAITTMLIGINASCASNTNSKPAAPAPAGGGVAAAPAPAARPTPPPTAPPAAPPAPGQVGGPPGGPPAGPPGGGRGPGGPGGRVQRTPEQMAAYRDSLTTMRAGVVADLMARLAGSENKRAGDAFTNVLLMKDSTAANFLKQMDYYGRSLSVGCTFCHMGGGKWDDDTKDAKKTTRVMIELVNLINTQGLSKLG